MTKAGAGAYDARGDGASAPLVSVVCAAYNHPVFFPRAVESVLAQELPHWELVIVDDGSTDETGVTAAASMSS